MRISGYGAGGGDSPRSRQGEERRQAFRRRHRVGERLQGTLLRWESPGLAWIRVAGHELLAWISDAPEPGQPLWFLVRELFPELVLQQLGQSEAPGPGLSECLQAWLEARRHFLPLVEGLGVPGGLSPAAREQAWVSGLASRPEAGPALARVLECLGALNRVLESNRLGRLLYLPWLLDGAHDLELLLCGADDTLAGLGLLGDGAALAPATDPAPNENAANAGSGAAGEPQRLTSLTLGFTHAQAGRCEARLLALGAQGSCRVRAERPTFADAACQMLAPLLTTTVHWEWHAPAPLPPGPPTVLAGLPGQSAAPVSMRLDARV